MLHQAGLVMHRASIVMHICYIAWALPPHTLRCFNAPHNWQLGWGTPLATFSSANLPPITLQTLFLPAQASERANMVVIKPDWVAGWGVGQRQDAWFLSHRMRSGQYDQSMPASMTNTTNVHWWDGMLQVKPEHGLMQCGQYPKQHGQHPKHQNLLTMANTLKSMANTLNIMAYTWPAS